MVFLWWIYHCLCASDCPACCVRAGRFALQPHCASVWKVPRTAAAALDVRRTVHLLQVGPHTNIHHYHSQHRRKMEWSNWWFSLYDANDIYIYDISKSFLTSVSIFTAMTRLGTRPWRTYWKLCWTSQVLVPTAWTKRKKTIGRKSTQ